MNQNFNLKLKITTIAIKNSQIIGFENFCFAKVKDFED